MNKEQQIKEMAQDFIKLQITTRQGVEAFAEILYNAGYRKTFTSELVSKEWHDEQVLHAESEIKRLQSENKTLRLAKDDFKKRFEDSGHRNKKLSLKLSALKKEIRNAKTEAVEEFVENLEARCFDELFYMDLHDAIEKELKERLGE